jgi:hypothetical protein
MTHNFENGRQHQSDTCEFRSYVTTWNQIWWCQDCWSWHWISQNSFQSFLCFSSIWYWNKSPDIWKLNDNSIDRYIIYRLNTSLSIWYCDKISTTGSLFSVFADIFVANTKYAHLSHTQQSNWERGVKKKLYFSFMARRGFWSCWHHVQLMALAPCASDGACLVQLSTYNFLYPKGFGGNKGGGCILAVGLLERGRVDWSSPFVRGILRFGGCWVLERQGIGNVSRHG